MWDVSDYMPAHVSPAHRGCHPVPVTIIFNVLIEKYFFPMKAAKSVAGAPSFAILTDVIGSPILL